MRPVHLESEARRVAAVLVAAAVGVVLLARGESTTASDTQPVVTAPPAPPLPTAPDPPAEAPPAPVQVLPSRAIGKPFAGRLVRGVQLAPEGTDFFTWDPILKRSPNRDWRRWGTDRLLLTLTQVLADYRALHPGAPRVGIGDLSRPHGGNFGPRFGRPGHASHQNGLDVDVYYPRWDGFERRAWTPRLVDHGLAQDLVDLFVAAGARYVFVGPRVGLHGPRRVVQPLASTTTTCTCASGPVEVNGRAALGPSRASLPHASRYQRRSDRAAEVAERGDVHGGRAVVHEEVGHHRLTDALDVGLAEPRPEAAADDHGLHVEQVDRGGDPGAERLDRLVDQLRRERVRPCRAPAPRRRS